MSELAETLLTHERRTRFREVAASRLATLTLVLENLYDPHNISACLRTAECFGLTEVHVVGENPYRCQEDVSLYANRWLTVHQYPDLPALVAALRGLGYHLLGAVSAAGEPLDDATVPNKAAICVGTERYGLSPELLAVTDGQITIPTFGFTQSLNVSAAVTVLLHHYATAYRRQGSCYLTAAEQDKLIAAWCRRDVRNKTRGQLG